jgi:hypothetical protein
LERVDEVFEYDVSTRCKEQLYERLWKVVFYRLVENMRGYIKTGEIPRHKIVEHIDFGLGFYISFLEQKCHEHRINPGDLHKEYFKRSDGDEEFRMRLLCLQNTLVYIGDLLRYRLKYQHKIASDYKAVNFWYWMAARMYPDGGNYSVTEGRATVLSAGNCGQHR